MKKRFINPLSLLVLSLCCGNLLAGSITVPNTFVGGTTASASEVNANFNAIKTAVDDNDSRITSNTSDISANAANIAANTNAIRSSSGVGAFINGMRVGTVIEYPVPNSFPSPYFIVLLLSDYLARIEADGSGISSATDIQTVFTSADCTGQAYAATGAFFSSWSHFHYLVFLGQGQLYETNGGDPVAYRYIPPGSAMEDVLYQSGYMGSGGCDAVSIPGPSSVFKVYANDPNVTGFTNTDLVGPITIGH